MSFSRVCRIGSELHSSSPIRSSVDTRSYLINNTKEECLKTETKFRREEREEREEAERGPNKAHLGGLSCPLGHLGMSLLVLCLYLVQSAWSALLFVWLLFAVVCCCLLLLLLCCYLFVHGDYLLALFSTLGHSHQTQQPHHSAPLLFILLSLRLL